MATYDLSEFLEDDAITLEGVRSGKHPEGRAYRFASPSLEVGLWLKNLVEFGQRAALLGPKPTREQVTELASDVGKLELDDGEEMDLYRRVMGDTIDELLADGVSHERTQRIFALLLKKWGQSQPIEVSLQEAAAGEAGARANRATRRKAVKAPARKASARSSSPKGGSRSSRASSGTKARTASPASTRSRKTSGAKAAQTG